MNKKIIFYSIFSLLCLIVFLNYHNINAFVIKTFDETEMGFVNRVIDGDTIIVNNQSIRMLGINTPERGEKYYLEAKKSMEELVLNKTVYLKTQKEKKDLYNRTLAYVFINKQDINLEQINRGYASPYFPTEEKRKEYYLAWETCLKEEKNLCEKSKHICANCIKLKEINVENQKITLENICNFKCNLTKWEIKDEGRKKYIFQYFYLDKKKSFNISAEDFKQDYVWTKTGDGIFIRDDLGKIVIYYSY